MDQSFFRAVEALTEEYDMCPPGAAVLCAVSGGADSMCLLHLLDTWGRARGITLAAAHFDHGMRPTSARDAAFVADWCRQRGIPLLTGGADVPAEARKRGKSPEETARELRYAFLEQAADRAGASRIATAHHADDNLETLLLRLCRGTGLQGLSGIPPRRGRIVRPLLEVSRADILAYLKEFDVPHVEDETNGDCSNPRNRIRHQVVPVLRTLNGGLTAAAARTQRGLREDEAFLTARAARAVAMARKSDDGISVFASAVASLPEAAAIRAVRRLVEEASEGTVRCSAVHLKAVAALCRSSDPSARTDLPGGWEAVRSYDLLLVRRRPEEGAAPEEVPLDLRGVTEWGGEWRIRCSDGVCPEHSHKNPLVFYLSRDRMEGTLTVRSRRSGDRMALAGRTGSKSLKKWMIECRVPRLLRDKLPVIADRDGAAAAAGIGTAARCAAKPGEPCLRVECLRR